MKRHVQQTGIRQWAGEDLLELQSEPLKALDRFFAEYGNCVIEGCAVTGNGDNSYNIDPGLVALSGTDVDGKATFKVVPFSGVEGTPLPVYLTLTYGVVERAYMDNKVKPIAYDYRAAVSAIKPDELSYLELSQAGILRFVDMIQNSTHRFFTDVERKKLQGIEEGAIKYIHPSSHPASMIDEDATRRFMTDAERTKLNGIEAGAIKYVHPDKHPATLITEDEVHRFVSDSEKNVWNGKAPGGHKHTKSEITDFPTSMPASDVPGWAKAPNKPSYTAAEVGAALASHSHSAGEVSEDVNRRFVSDSEKSNWNSKAAGNHNHDTVYQPKGNYQPAGNYAPASHGHSAGEVSVDANRRFVTDAEKNEWNSKAAGGHNHSGVYQPAGNYQPAGSYAPSSHGHSAGEISEDGSHRFVSDGEKNEWNSKASGSHNHSGVYQPAGNYQPAGSYAAANHGHDGTYQPAGSYAAGNHNHDTVYQPKGNYQPAGSYASSSHSHDGTYQPAGSYAAASHGHSAGQVSEEANRRWMTDAERSALSTLGTYAKADFSNITSKSMGQNGYYKLPDGLLIQWGYASQCGNGKTIYLPISFYDSSYNITFGVCYNNTSEQVVLSAMFGVKEANYFNTYVRYVGDSGGTHGSAYPVCWLAIGRWK